jgi:Xaa-Pro aminopeptidase
MDATRERYARVQAAMARHGVGVLLLASPQLGAFASGARRVQVAGSGGSVPWVGIAAGAAAPLVFTPDPDGAPAWYPPASVAPLCWDREAQLARLATLLERAPGHVACDVFSAGVRALAAAHGRSLVDGVAIVEESLAPKSAAEVDGIAVALAAARAGLRAALAAVAPGATPAALVARFAALMSEARAGFPLSEGLVWRVGERLVRLAPAARLVAGDAVALEMGLSKGGHAGVAGDTLVVGGADDPSARRRWGEVVAGLGAVCCAGATTADLRGAARAAGAAEAGLLAYGLGVGVEPPHLRLVSDDAAPLRAGTVLVLAPVVGSVRATRALLVTDGPPRWLEGEP